MNRDEARILVVDDEVEVLAVLGDLLESLGYRPECVRDGETALQRVAERELDLVLLDLGLGDISGVTVLQRIKHASPDTEVIIVTGQTSVDPAAAAVRLDAFAYLQKPFGLVVLADTVERALERRHRRTEETEQLEQLMQEEAGTEEDPTDPLHRAAQWQGPDAVVVADADGFVRLANKEAVRLTGYAARQMRGLHLGELVDLEEDWDYVWQILAERDRLTGFETFLVNTCTRRRIAVEVNWSALQDDSGSRIGIAGAFRDVTETRPLVREMNVANQRLQALAVTDPVTGLYNHRHFQAALRVEVERARRHGRPVSLMMMDLDLFKEVNDVYGHSFGDEVLRRMAAAVESQLRTSDIPCRYGGDEFAIVLPETRGEDAATLAERVAATIADLRTPAPNSATHVRISVSVGVATFPDDGDAVNEIIAYADQCLYEAKSRGGSRVVDARASARA